MDLKSRMSLDISNVTKNLQKVASQTSSLSRRMASTFDSAKNSLGEFNAALKQDMKLEGTFNTIKGQAIQLGNSLSSPFRKMGLQAIESFTRLKEYSMSIIPRIKASWQSLKSTFSTDVKLYGFVEATKAHLIQLASAISQVKTALPLMKNALVRVHTTLTNFTTGAVKPLTKALDKAGSKLAKWSASIKGFAYEGNTAVKELEKNVKKSGMQFKDVARIVQGIMVSKLFYTSLNAIRSATAEVWEFAKALEYSRLVYINFFGSLAMAKDFTQVLQDFAANTRFGFTELNKSAQQLLAYGFEAKNLMFVLKGVSAAASISGDTAKIESIARALGQINTKGRLMSEEMRQLAEAGIPAYEILQEKLGLSYKQMQNLGDEAIPASAAINALIDGINERFGGLLESSNKTTSGMLSNIKDVWLQLAAQAFDPLIQRTKSFVSSFLSLLMELKDIYATSGLGGIFERLVPIELQDVIRSLLGNIIMLVRVLGTWKTALMEILAGVAPTFLTWINMVLSVLIYLTRISANIISAITSNAAALKVLTSILIIAGAAWGAYKVAVVAAAITKGMIKIIDGLSNSLKNMSNFLTKLAQHPFILFAVAVTLLLLTLTGTFDKARDSVNSFFNSLNGVSGTKLLQPKEMKKSTEALGKYEDRLDDTANAMENMADKTKKASKSVLSFDEVFNNNTLDENDNISDEWQGFLEELSAGTFDPSSLLEDIDVTDFADPFVDSLMFSFSESLKGIGEGLVQMFEGSDVGTTVLSALIATLSLAVLGFTPAGIWTAVAVLLAGAFWDDVTAAFGVDPTVNIGTLIVGAVMAALAVAMFGFTPVGLFVGITSLIVGSFWSDLKKLFGVEQKFDWYNILIGAVMASVAIMTIGATPAGLFVAIAALLVGTFWDDLTSAFGLEPIPLAVGGAIGGAIGLLAGQPLLGLGAGLLAGAVVSDIWSKIKSAAENGPDELLKTGLALAIGGALGALVGHPLLGAGIAELAVSLASSLFGSTKKSIKEDIKALELANELNTKVSEVAALVATNIIDYDILTTSINDNYEKLKLLVDKVYELSDQESLSNAEKVTMLSLIDDLNGAMPGLNMSYDGTTGKINLQKEAVNGLIESTKNYQKVMAYKDILTGAAKAEAEAVLARNKAYDEYAIAKKKYDDEKEDYADAEEEYGEFNKTLFGRLGNSSDLKAARKEMMDAEIALNVAVKALHNSRDTVDTASSFYDQVQAELDSTIAKYNEMIGVHALVGMSLDKLGGVFKDGVIVMGTSATEAYDAILAGLYPSNGQGYVDTATGAVYTFGQAIVDGIPTNITIPSTDVGAAVMTSIKAGMVDNEGLPNAAIATWSQGSIDIINHALGFDSAESKPAGIGKNVVGHFAKGVDDEKASSETSVSTWFNSISTILDSWLADSEAEASTWSETVISYFASWLADTKTKSTEVKEVVTKDINTWTDDTDTKTKTWSETVISYIDSWSTDTKAKSTGVKDDITKDINTWTDDTDTKTKTWIENVFGYVKSWSTDIKDKSTEVKDGITEDITTWTGSTEGTIKTWTENAGGYFSTFMSTTLTNVGTWASNIGSSVSNALSSAWSAASNLASLAVEAVTTVTTPETSSDPATPTIDTSTKAVTRFKLTGHRVGGVFNREHVANFAEGNKAEAIIPLENKSAMQPFVDAVSDGLVQALAPVLASFAGGSTASLPPMYVGALLADERGLKELHKRFKVIDAEDIARRSE